MGILLLYQHGRLDRRIIRHNSYSITLMYKYIGIIHLRGILYSIKDSYIGRVFYQVLANNAFRRGVRVGHGALHGWMIILYRRWPITYNRYNMTIYVFSSLIVILIPLLGGISPCLNKYVIVNFIKMLIFHLGYFYMRPTSNLHSV